jgi:hypothetical protein
MKTPRTGKYHLLVILCLLAVGLSACTSEAEQFLQGKWGIGDVHYWAEWNFDSGTYWYESGYTQEPIFERGRYRVIESGTDYIILELFDQEGGIPSIEDKVEIRIEFNYQQDSIHLRRTDYYRVNASSLEALATSRAP